MNANLEFQGFPKMGRLSREMVITEKLDGTNAQILIGQDGSFKVGSRTRWITPDDDNHGFARWAYDHQDELMGLGHGRHFGEWWGSGIQRGYGLRNGDKRFSLFNSVRWHTEDQPTKIIPCGDPTQPTKYQELTPRCVGVVPELYRGLFDTDECIYRILQLEKFGSVAAPGFMHPEGIVAFHLGGNVGFKKTIIGDGHGKSSF